MSWAHLFNERIPPTWATDMEARLTERITAVIMATTQEVIDTVTSQLAKARDEITSKIADLEAKDAAGQPVDLEPLKQAASDHACPACGYVVSRHGPSPRH